MEGCGLAEWKGANYAAIRQRRLPIRPAHVTGLQPRSGYCLTARGTERLDLGQGDALLALVLAPTVLVRGLADLVRLEENHLSDAFVGVDLRRKRRRVRELQRDKAFPLGLERCHVDDDAAAGVRRLSEANCEHVARDAEIFDGAGEGEGIGR